ncbi:hypothetical protein [Alteromonas sp. W12]|uniref:hypothetical protein n=1 Tax=Alteromonas sp. W12 TaxID=1772289 RepID=UPI001115408E|nr:hypothetical protein [Alteromonas sp. W12]
MMKILFLALIIFFYTPLSSACSCGKLMSIEESFLNSKAVLLVEVDSLKAVKAKIEGEESKRVKFLEASFTTIESFKADEEGINVLRTYSNCGLKLYPSQKYLVFIPIDSHVENYVSHCDGSFHYLPQLDYSQLQLSKVREYAHNKPL